MARCFGVKSNNIGACLGKLRDNGVDRLDHQVHVDGGIGVRAYGFANHRAHRQIWNVMVVHDIKMNPVGAGGDNVAHFFAQAGEVS